MNTSLPGFALLRLAFVSSLSLAAVALVGGCGSSTVVCEPECPSGFTCTETGCVGQGGQTLDMATGGDNDMAGCPTACTGATPHCGPGNRCVACLTDDHCPSGQVCKMAGQVTVCVPGCSDDARCRAGGAPASMACCNGGCLDTAKDASNCGACGTVCGGNHSSATCAAGKCVPGACSPGWGDCNGDPADGCEVSLRSDPNNCTSCGNKCDIRNAVAGCSDAEMPACYIAACKFGFDDCNGDPKDGCEVSVLADAKNCGACGAPCANKPNAQVQCINAACQLTSCILGFADCNSDAKDGCEVTIATDAKNCGACGNACPQGQICKNGGCTCGNCNIPNAKTKCVNNVCTFDGCAMGYGDCNNNVADGCEVNLTADANNCGACNMVCPQNAPNCFNAQCQAGFTHHDGLGHTWVDNVPTGTLTIQQAGMACQVYINEALKGNDQCSLQGCGCGGQDLCVYNINAQPRYTWFYNNGNMGGQVTLNCCGCQAQGKWD